MTYIEDDNGEVWDLAEKIGFCMLTTQSGADLKARPMSAYIERVENALYFLTDVKSHKDDEVARHPNVCLAFADTKKQKYVSISGVAEVQNDREKIRDLNSCQGMVGQPRRSLHSHSQSYAKLGRILGQSRHCDQLHQDGSGSRHQRQTGHGRKRQSADVGIGGPTWPVIFVA